MPDPFQIRQPSPHTDKNIGPLSLELDSDGNGMTGGVKVPCRCGAPLERTLYPPFDWVHVGDEVIVQGGVVIQGSAYDHLPSLDVIDL